MDKYGDKTADTLCRTCLQLLLEDCLKHDIFLTPDLEKKLIICTPLTVDLQDGFPKNLCDCCYNKVNEFHKFHNLCVESVQRFRDIQRQQEVKDYAFEEPEFDLEDQAKLEITITEPAIYFRNEICKDLYTVDGHDDKNVNERHVRTILRERGPKTMQTVNKEPKVNVRILNNQMRSTRSQTCKLKEENAAVERLFKEKINNSNRWSIATSDDETLNNEAWKVADGADSENMWEEDENEEDERINLRQNRVTTEETTITHVCNSAGNLKMHVRTVHERAKDYACRFCERTFAKPDTRKYHEMTHTGEKPNECKECGKRFTQPAALRTHRKIHLRHRTEAVTQVEENAVDSANGNVSSVSLELSTANCMLSNAIENVTSEVTALPLLPPTENSGAIVESQMQNFMQSS